MRIAWPAFLLAACATGPAPEPRPAHWAQPAFAGEADNCYRISPDLYRCGQPSAAAMRALEARGIQSIVNLRQYHSDADEVAGTTLALFEVPLDAGDLDYPRLVTALRALVVAPKPVAVHCWRGSDRTGAVVAAWRVAVDGWTPAQAVEEMVTGGFGHFAWYGGLRALVLGLDAGQLRADVGLPRRER